MVRHAPCRMQSYFVESPRERQAAYSFSSLPYHISRNNRKVPLEEYYLPDRLVSLLSLPFYYILCHLYDKDREKKVCFISHHEKDKEKYSNFVSVQSF